MEPSTNTVVVVAYQRVQQKGFDWKNFSALDRWSLMAGRYERWSHMKVLMYHKMNFNSPHLPRKQGMG